MKVRCNQCMNIFDEDEIVYDSERDMEFCPKCGEDGCLMDFAKTIYCVSGLGYDENDCITDYEHDFGAFDTYEEAYDLFFRLQFKPWELFFLKEPKVYQLLIQLEECEEDDEEIRCVDVINEWNVINPNFKGA